jgi:hypothetical protein
MHGNVSFIELGTSDTERSRPFFQRVFGWTFTPNGARRRLVQAPSMRVGFHGEDTPQIYVFFEVPDLEQAIIEPIDYVPQVAIKDFHPDVSLRPHVEMSPRATQSGGTAGC